MRWLVRAGIPLALLGILYLVWFPAHAIVQQATFWSASKTPDLAAETLGGAPSGAELQKLYFISYTIHISSLMPFRMTLLNAVPESQEGLTVHPVELPFAQNVGAFQRTGVSALFLVEIQGENPEEIARKLQFSLRAGEKVWPRIHVRIPSAIPVVNRQDSTFG